MRKHRMFVLGAGLLALSLFAAACGDSGGDDTGGGATDTASAEPKGEIVVGVSGAFAENQLVAEMYAQVLETDGYTVTRELDIADRAVGNEALAAGEIDLKPEYTGFDCCFFDPKATANGEIRRPIADALAAAARTRGSRDLRVLPGEQHERVRRHSRDGRGERLTDMSSLAAVAGDLTLGAPPDCPKSRFCIPGLKETYGVEFGEFKALDFGGPKTVAAIDSGAVEVGELFSLEPDDRRQGLRGAHRRQEPAGERQLRSRSCVRRSRATSSARCSTASRRRSPTRTCWT